MMEPAYIASKQRHLKEWRLYCIWLLPSPVELLDYLKNYIIEIAISYYPYSPFLRGPVDLEADLGI